MSNYTAYMTYQYNLSFPYLKLSTSTVLRQLISLNVIFCYLNNIYLPIYLFFYT